MYGYLPGFCIRVFLVRVLSHSTICSAFSFLLHSCASGQSFSMRGERVPHCSEHGDSLCLITELYMQLAWKEEKSLKNYWSGVCAGVTCFPLRASSQGQVDIQDCSLVGLVLAPRGCSDLLPGVQNGGHYMFAYNFPVPAVTEAPFNCIIVVLFLSFVSE